ncbi:MAG TPA: type II CRISPR-associated endonuclease Cas1 [Porphyromonadaceae bacterium]|jgi:CRISPR-associated protein Cas1|uniref:type II CRISPR-associated endonuclease Cas1 n=1 Tax=Proteiniphilum sp. UBA5346 TaxID=1947277 RepID=UPI000E82C508|nr:MULTISPECIES: type II CRISPR-associated endonuclease Cas1 [unclassified Proteiniphilum]HBU44167.1 type II CRISPR-associated endonuclease Cas1 [Porphyromonadaceae bacterium]HCB00629.1 type II CRISPR-associated endonuclease Cas1 [Porphyromonadaceae bacterium]
MIKRTLYFGNPAYLSLKKEQLVIQLPEVVKNSDLSEKFKQDAVSTIPIEDIGMVVLDNKQITVTHGVMEKLLANNCALITCDSNRMPMGLMLPLSGNTTQTERFKDQIEASVPLKKQLWQQTVEAKIRNQAYLLEKSTSSIVRNMLAWANDVKSGDPDNYEARAAVYYWANLFPKIQGFTRHREGIAPNNLLNYGYAVLRAVIARSLVASGLLPTLGIHHRNKYNAYCLADDIMEPYRPFVDSVIIDILKKNDDISEISKEHKTLLLNIPVLDVVINGQRSPLMIAVAQTTASLYQCFAGKIRKIKYPSFE